MNIIFTKKSIIINLIFLILGFIYGLTIHKLFENKEPIEQVKIDYDSVCKETLKSYYVEQNPVIRKKIINEAAKKLSIDKMLSN